MPAGGGALGIGNINRYLPAAADFHLFACIIVVEVKVHQLIVVKTALVHIVVQLIVPAFLHHQVDVPPAVLSFQVRGIEGNAEFAGIRGGCGAAGGVHIVEAPVAVPFDGEGKGIG